MRRFVLSLALVAAGFVGGLVLTGRMRSAADSRAETQRAEQPRAAVAREAAPASSAGVVNTGPDFTRVAAQAVKGVVNISSITVVRTRNSPFPNDDLFRYFFGDS